ncbi:MAG TPA: LuxR C-terminal-related transcriptional regulator, partial [Myxococcaceae bacterium]|nr:LuxR C-terminal-related transcriptional regulator [Myxococcaceae bacterium]
GRGVSSLYSSPSPEGGLADAAVRAAEAALAVAREHRFDLLEIESLCLLGAAAWAASDHSRAAAAAAAAIGAADARGWQDSWWTGTASAVLAHASLMRAAPETALGVAADGLRTGAARDPVVEFALRCVHGAALVDLGDGSQGLLELQEAHSQFGETPVDVRVAVSAALLEHRASLLLGSPAAAATSMGRLTAREPAAGELALMRAWSEAAGGSFRTAHAAVLPLLDGSVSPTLQSTLVEAWLVEGWAALRSGDRAGARRALRTALGLAEPLDLLRPFMLAGHGLRVLLVDQLSGGGNPDAFAFRCLAARRGVRRVAGPQLSAREQAVLAQLVSLSSLGEIAEDMAVSINTVKSHVHGIYSKLGANTRRTAVLAALERGLIA